MTPILLRNHFKRRAVAEMIPQKRASEEDPDVGQAAKRQGDMRSGFNFAPNNDGSLPSLRWLFEQSHEPADCNNLLPSLGEETPRSSTPAIGRNIPRHGTHASAQRKAIVAAREISIEAGEDVCYGMIPNVNCQLLRGFVRVAAEDISAADDSHSNVSLALTLQPSRCLVGLSAILGIAQMNMKYFKVMQDLSLWSRTEVHAYMPRLECHDLFTRRPSLRSSERSFHIHLNIQGPAHLADEVGAKLSENGIYLQDPSQMSTSLKYHNPHVLQLGGLESVDVWLRELALQPSNAQTVDTDWSAALDDLDQAHAGSQFDGGEVLNTRLVNATQLMRHQLDALDFMCRRERAATLDDAMRYWLHVEEGARSQITRHRITGIERSERQDEPRGGIVADDMGLGKTLTTLSLIVSSQDHAKSFAAARTGGAPNIRPLPRTGATLVIVPNNMILDSWIREVAEHFVPHTLRVMTYHGPHRTRHIAAVQCADLVMTTYGTVTSDVLRRRDVLDSLEWYRIVLDEAHTIRSQTTTSFKAVMKLAAQHHWCLTGTPISNKVEDLGALVAFCRVPQLEDCRCFHAHVTKIATKSFKKGCRLLKEVLSPICLRRTKAILAIPQTRQEARVVHFTLDERQSYDTLLRDIRRSLDESVSGKAVNKTLILETILRLREFCDQGTFTSTPGAATDRHFDPDEALAMLQQADEARCAFCHSEVEILAQTEVSSSAVLGTCTHLICASCHDDGPAFEADQRSTFFCPICHSQVPQQTSGSTGRPSCEANLKAHSSKLTAVVADLIETRHCEKSIVFSCWQKTLDVAATLCNNSGLQWARIDGKTSQRDRVRALNRFTTNSNVSVLLMTVGTGALGLNLTAAKRIHIVEPQWNPAVESQAVGRIVRIGQESSTTVVRYYVAGSIEEQIKTYQKRKLQLAAAGFDR